VVGTDTADDAAVWRRPDGPALVATADFFTPIVDDARTWGRIAAANAASDVYAMGGRPLFALNLVAWPREQLPLDLLGDVLAGGAEAAADGGWLAVGGHTVDGTEPMYGQAVVGEVDEAVLLTNAGGRPGDALVLTKPLGTGIVATAVKRREPADVEPGGRLHTSYVAAVAEMTRLNAAAARAATTVGAHAATDVTGFGLLGHLAGLARASGLAAEVVAVDVPVLPGIGELLDAGYVPGGTHRNLAAVRPALTSHVDEHVLTLLADAQTSGGLLIACDEAAARDVVAELASTGHAAAVVGHLTDGEPGAIEVV
jgi:selenide, water dikinase